jgi:hypothetical protein
MVNRLMWNSRLIWFDPETMQALELLAAKVTGTRGETFTGLWAKHDMPRTLKDALKQTPQITSSAICTKSLLIAKISLSVRSLTRGLPIRAGSPR